MKLADAARRGDTLTATDAYGTDTIKVQFDPLNLTKLDGVAVRKRVLSIAPDVVLPTRGAITINGQVYLAGHAAPDFWRGKVIRSTVVIQGADGLANLTSIGNALLSVAPVTAYAAAVFSRYLPDAADSSKYPPQYQIFLAGSEIAPADTLIQLETTWYLVKESYISTSGLRIALTNTLDEPTFETISFGSQVYDPIIDSYVGTPTMIKILRVKWQEHFSYLSKSSETYERGDQQIFVPKSVTPNPSDTLSLSDATWRILAVQDETTHWSCHVRRN